VKKYILIKEITKKALFIYFDDTLYDKLSDARIVANQINKDLKVLEIEI